MPLRVTAAPTRTDAPSAGPVISEFTTISVIGVFAAVSCGHSRGDGLGFLLRR